MSFAFVIFFLLAQKLTLAAEEAQNVVLAVHGGTSDHFEIPKELEEPMKEGIREALKAGYEKLIKTTSSLDAVEAAVNSLENNPLFNAGKGAVFTLEGKNELDASIMSGKDKKAGAVASVTTIKNPISAARKVMEETRHVLLVADGAEKFAKKAGLKIVPQKYFYTERRWKEHLEAMKDGSMKSSSTLRNQNKRIYSLGTTGAIAIDEQGNLAAGTSTGGLTNKMHGRIGDSPIIGAGTYADNSACAVSSTGIGEVFIRLGVAHEICARVRLNNSKISKAADEIVQGELKKLNSDGGVIALDPKGNLAMSYNSEYLPRGYVTKNGEIKVFLK